MKRRGFNLLFLFILITPGLTLGLPEDREKPINLEANSAQFDQISGVSTYQGNVVVTQGTMRLTADIAKIYIREGEFRRMEAEGNPTTFRYQPAADKEIINGEGRQVEYDVGSAKVIVTDNAKFTQGQDVFTGDRIEYDLNKDLVTANSNKGGRVKITIQPKSKKLPQ